MPNKQTRFFLAIALQVAVILAIIIFKLSVLIGGTDILLQITPIDPRDVLRGDYATFQYSISNVDSYDGQQIRNGDTVYVVLSQSGKYWTARGVKKTKPIGDDLFIKGTVEMGGVDDRAYPVSYQRLHIRYGIEQYFIPEGKGRNFSFWNKKAAARVAVDDDGNPVLRQIYVDDKPWP